jgi:hypothetical protein
MLGFAVAVSALVSFAAPAEVAGVGNYWGDEKRWFFDGGTTMWFILACSILGVAFNAV